MTLVHPLLVMRHRKEADQLAAMIAAAGSVHAAPAYTDTMQGALDLLAQRRFGVLILDDQLRGGTGIQALARVRQRYPALPVIMVSAAQSEDAAIDAFHLGVADYIPRKRGYGDRVVGLVTQLAAGEPPAPPTRQLDVPDHVPEVLFDPTYQNRLRVIGCECDALGLRELTILEATAGFVVQASVPQEKRAEVLEFADAHFARLASEAATMRGQRASTPPHALLPTGYEDALRALGHELDRRTAERVTILELEQCLLVCGHQPTEGHRENASSRFEWVLAAEELAALLDGSYDQRSRGQATPGRGVS
jgi:DNA-binding NarL/FixJ family response regulator